MVIASRWIDFWQWCSRFLSLVSCHKSLQRDLNPNFKGLLSRGIEGAHLKWYKRCTGENDPYLCYCNNFLNGLTFSGLFKLLIVQHDSPKKTTLLYHFSDQNVSILHYHQKNQVQTPCPGIQGSLISSQHPCQPNGILFSFFPIFLALLLPGKCTPRLSVCLSLCFSSYKSFNTFLYYLPSIWPGIKLPSYVEVL